MNRTSFLGVIPLSGLLIWAFSATTPSLAQCVVADTSVQVSVNGSREPAQQSNDVEVDTPENCSRNRSVSTGRQVQVGGTDPVIQKRRSRHQINNRTEESESAGSGSSVVIPVEVQLDVYNAADEVSRPEEGSTQRRYR